ncbi:MAG: TerB family tellurite resistance protein [Bryobacterales bacterium]|nr:TerB family tellurite resistance protein [Bryobacterales bacterium]
MAIFDFIDSLLKGASGASSPVGDTESVRKIVRLLEGMSPERARFLGAMAYLMARVAHADFHVSEEELAKMREVLQTHGGLPEEQAEAVAELARQQSVHEGSTEDFLVTREFKRIATRDEMLHLLDCLFALSATEDSISVVEESAIRQIASELNLEHREFIAVKSRYRDRLEVFQPGTQGAPEPGEG